MHIVTIYEQQLKPIYPPNSLVLMDAGGGRYCAFGPTVSGQALYQRRKYLTETETVQRPDGNPCVYSTNRPGFNCLFVCGEWGRRQIAGQGFNVVIVPAGEAAEDCAQLWAAQVEKHPKFVWFGASAPIAVSEWFEPKPEQLRLL